MTLLIGSKPVRVEIELPTTVMDPLAHNLGSIQPPLKQWNPTKSEEISYSAQYRARFSPTVT